MCVGVVSRVFVNPGGGTACAMDVAALGDVSREVEEAPAAGRDGDLDDRWADAGREVIEEGVGRSGYPSAWLLNRDAQ